MQPSGDALIGSDLIAPIFKWGFSMISNSIAIILMGKIWERSIKTFLNTINNDFFSRQAFATPRKVELNRKQGSHSRER